MRGLPPSNERSASQATQSSLPLTGRESSPATRWWLWRSGVCTALRLRPSTGHYAEHALATWALVTLSTLVDGLS